MAKLDTKALEGILEFLVKSRKPKKLDESVDMSELEEIEEDDMEETDIEDDLEEVVENVRPVPGRKPKSMSMSITQLGLRSKPKFEDKPKAKKKGKK